MDNKIFITEGFRKIFGTAEFDEAFLRQMFDTSYIQHVDGKTMGLEEFIQHMKLLKERTQSIHVDFRSVITEGEIVFSNHVVEALMKDGSSSVIQVIAEFRINNGKVYYCDELTHLISGDAASRDLGSAH